ncbi:MAG: hypothetical protein AVDCRST_MAG18-5129 [uncultured Thermomicrobiales bacterium]|uniref:Uncharacterized protein n=1 Tax=uncultured Thermomicrobiales bacterium TaxID=1645740 RepID=A0A6J4VXK3_9BACT|nr:MAG: hypothetical protein AVDCRST_MAG18-5129 [uncultured Thermomicrobiales bacterium]
MTITTTCGDRSAAAPPPDLWWRWVAANAAGEAIGLGGTALVGLALLPRLGDARMVAAVATAALAVAAGTAIEGLAVGTAQWLVLRRPLPELPWGRWAGATAAGAGIAWTAGMLPSTLLALGQDAAQAPATEPSAAVVYPLAFLMGLVLGPVLGGAQWLVLRRYRERAWWWIAANAPAWGCGMVLIFAGIDALVALGPGPAAAILAVILLAAVGATVGAIHGLALVRLVARRAHAPG